MAGCGRLPFAPMAESRRVLLVALVANAVAAGVKLAAFSLTGASVLLSEGLHSLSDCGNEIALLAGHRRRPSSEVTRYLLGVTRARYLWAFLASVVVFGGGAVGSFVEATYRLLHPESGNHAPLVAAAILVAMAVEAGSMSLAVADSRSARAGMGWMDFVSQSRDPDLPVLLVEDLADLGGLILALLGSTLAALTGVAVFDAVASYLIGLILAANAVFLTRTMGRLLLGESAGLAVERAVLEAVSGGRLRPTAVHTAHLGPEELLVVVELAVDPDLSSGDLVAETDLAQARINTSLTETCQVFFEMRLP